MAGIHSSGRASCGRYECKGAQKELQHSSPGQKALGSLQQKERAFVKRKLLLRINTSPLKCIVDKIGCRTFTFKYDNALLKQAKPKNSENSRNGQDEFEFRFPVLRDRGDGANPLASCQRGTEHLSWL